MGSSLGMQAEKVIVVGHNDSPLLRGVCQLFAVAGTQKARPMRSGHVNAACSKAAGDGGIHLLVKMEPDHLLGPQRHGVFGPEDPGRSYS